MSSEYSIEEPTSGPSANRRWPLKWDWTGKGKWLLAIAIATLGVGSVWLSLRLIPGQKTSATRGLTLLESAVQVPAASFKNVDILLPCAGTLSLDITVPKGSDVNVFVVAPGELAKMEARKTFSHLPGFDGNHITAYHRSRPLSPGRYCIMLMNRAGQPPSTKVLVNARLNRLQ